MRFFNTYDLQFYTCGSTAASNGIRDACITLIERHLGSHERAVAAFASIQRERFAADVFG